MAKQAEIQVYPIAQTSVNFDEVNRWLVDLGAEKYAAKISESDDLPSDPALLVALAAKRCYASFEPGLNPNVTRVRENWLEYLDNVLKSGHGSVTECAVFSFAIEGCTRVCTAELNRHRAGVAISEGSMRYIRWDPKNGFPVKFWLPTMLKRNGTESRELELKKQETEHIFYEWFGKFEEQYNRLLELWAEEMEQDFDTKKKLTSMFRRLAPMGVSTGGVWSFNIRALRHIIALRSSPHAEEEIVVVVGKIMECLQERCPELFADFKCADGFWKPEYQKV